MKNTIACVILSMVIGMISVSNTLEAKKPGITLKVVVVDEEGNKIIGAKVSVFETEADYRAETNKIGESVITNKKGMAKIQMLGEKEYYVLAEKDKMSNIGQAVMLEKLGPKKKSLVTIMIK